MTQMTRTWWGTKFMNALSGFMEEGRLKRGRGYSGERRIISFSMKNNTISAKMRGNINPYFGVYKEPKYNVKLKIKAISSSDWDRIISRLSDNAAMISRLMLFEMPDNIESIFKELNKHFLPHSSDDIESDCSCPDWENPCKHVAGAYYKVSQLLDVDPFLMFQLRGLSKEDLYKQLKKTDIGKALISSLSQFTDIKLEFSDSFYTKVHQESFDNSISLSHFWNGKEVKENKIEENDEEDMETQSLIIKKQGDYPSFWNKNNSFFETMEMIYNRIQMKNKKAL